MQAFKLDKWSEWKLNLDFSGSARVPEKGKLIEILTVVNFPSYFSRILNDNNVFINAVEDDGDILLRE